MNHATGSKVIANPPLRALGGTGIRISPIGLGTWQFSEGKGVATAIWSPVSEADTDAIVLEAIAGGVNWFDTAELYGFGRSETGLSRALLRAEQAPGDVVIATKWNPLLRTAASLKRTIERRLESLRPFGIDLHQIHFPMSFSSVEAEMNAMADLIEAGKIRAAGVSNFTAQQMRRAHAALVRRGLVLASNQVRYSIFDRRVERNGILETALELGITIIAYSPLEMGLLSGKFHKDPALLQSHPIGHRLLLRRMIEKSRPLVAAMDGIAALHGVTVSQVALNWLVNSHGETVVAIPGAIKAQHARESAGAMRFSLSNAEKAEIDRLSKQASSAISVGPFRLR